MNKRISRIFRDKRVIISLIIIVVLFIALAPVVPSGAPAGQPGGPVGVFASVSYALTHHGVTYWNGHYTWGDPPVM